MTSLTNTKIKFYERGGTVRDKKRFAESKVHRPLSPNPTYGATQPILTPTYPNPILTPSLFQPGLDPLRTNLRNQLARALAPHPSLTTRNA
jgi:hypothetical protein